MATCSRVAAGLLAVALTLAGCGGTSSSSSSQSASSASTSAFDWLHPAPAPAGWPVARTPAGATMAYPPTWRQVHSDRGTVSAALLSAPNRYLGYLNLTPRQGNETLADWIRFRPDHNHDEGDRNITTVASASGLHFRTGNGSCVEDSYRTKTRTRYIEIACLVMAGRGGWVIVGAAPPAAWAAQSRSIERAISAVTT